jgi:hypothetical protein
MEGGFSPHHKLRQPAVISTALIDYWRAVQAKNYESAFGIRSRVRQLASAVICLRRVRWWRNELAARSSEGRFWRA